MNMWRVRPSRLQGCFSVPPSKSQSMRALTFALLAKGKSVIHNILPSPDIDAMLCACALLGARVERQGSTVEMRGVAGKILGAEDVIQAGNSGLVIRFLGAIAGLSAKPIVLTGDHSLRHRRPLQPLLDALSQLGAESFSLRGDGGAPIFIKGPFYPGCAVMEGEDSQPVSAMLIAAACGPGPVEIFVTSPGEKPWVDVTLSWLKRFDLAYTSKDYGYYKLAGKGAIEGFTYTVPADFSSLAYPLLAAIVTQSEIQLENIDFEDLQGDKQVITLFQQMGAQIEIDRLKRKLRVWKNRSFRGIAINVNDCIDATPILAVAGCFAEGKTELRGAGIARKKESDRISSIALELKKMGGKVEEHPDGLTIYHSPLKGSEVEAHQDHRLALSLAVAGLIADGETVIHGADASAKSYPNFCEAMQKAGVDIAWH